MNKVTSFLYYIVLFLGISNSTLSQIPNGSWRDHFAYSEGLSLAISKNKVFGSFERGGMLSYDKNDGEIAKLSKVTGLSDIDIVALNYSNSQDVLVIGYRSGNIDLLTPKGVVNIPAIKRKLLTGSKKINKVKTYGKLAYLACDFGIVVLDLDKSEVKDSYFFGPNGSTIKVNDLCILGNSLYAATELGIYTVELDSPNLLDHSFWGLAEGVSDNDKEHKLIESFADKLFAVQTLSNGKDQIKLYSNESWNNWNVFSDTLINNIESFNNKISICGNESSILLNEDLSIHQDIAVEKIKSLKIDVDGSVYSCGTSKGLSKHIGQELEQYRVNGPRFNPVGRVFAKDDQVWVSSGGPNKPYHNGGGYLFENDKWLSINSGWGNGLTDAGNFFKIAYHPTNNKHIYASSYLYGLFELVDNQVTIAHRYSNTPLFQNTLLSVVNVRIMGLDFDSKGNLWSIFDETDQPVYVLRNGEEWENPKLNASIFSSNQVYTDLLVTESDQVWILSRKQGIVVLKEEADGTVLERSFTIKNQDSESISLAYCMVEDKDGYVWVGTNKGAVFYPPRGDIFSANSITGNSVKIPRNDGTGLADILLDFEIINDIAIDGANRKWLATENSGLFLVSADGLKTLHQFTFDNSPLISNNVISVDVQQNTGEVFVTTNQGLVSFMGNATEGLNNFGDVYVYPNPIRPDYEGEITITGIIKDANIKITDISGNLVYETTSLGGQAVWNGKNFDGNRVNTGVYLVFMTNDDGTKTHISKLLFIH